MAATPWAGRSNTWLVITLTPKGLFFSFLFCFLFFMAAAHIRPSAPACQQEPRCVVSTQTSLSMSAGQLEAACVVSTNMTHPCQLSTRNSPGALRCNMATVPLGKPQVSIASKGKFRLHIHVCSTKQSHLACAFDSVTGASYRMQTSGSGLSQPAVTQSIIHLTLCVCG